MNTQENAVGGTNTLNPAIPTDAQIAAKEKADKKAADAQAKLDKKAAEDLIKADKKAADDLAKAEKAAVALQAKADAKALKDAEKAKKLADAAALKAKDAEENAGAIAEAKAKKEADAAAAKLEAKTKKDADKVAAKALKDAAKAEKAETALRLKSEGKTAREAHLASVAKSVAERRAATVTPGGRRPKATHIVLNADDSALSVPQKASVRGHVLAYIRENFVVGEQVCIETMGADIAAADLAASAARTPQILYGSALRQYLSKLEEMGHIDYVAVAPSEPESPACGAPDETGNASADQAEGQTVGEESPEQA